MGLEFRANGYAFWQRLEGRWVPLAPGTDPAAAEWPTTLDARIVLDGRPLRPGDGRGPQVICTGIEPGTPFELSLRANDRERLWAWPAERP